MGTKTYWRGSRENGEEIHFYYLGLDKNGTERPREVFFCPFLNGRNNMFRRNTSLFVADGKDLGVRKKSMLEKEGKVAGGMSLSR